VTPFSSPARERPRRTIHLVQDPRMWSKRPVAKCETLEIVL
jgi:hypothetical protein